jgi:hypothetical protein
MLFIATGACFAVISGRRLVLLTATERPQIWRGYTRLSSIPSGYVAVVLRAANS